MLHLRHPISFYCCRDSGRTHSDLQHHRSHYRVQGLNLEVQCPDMSNCRQTKSSPLRGQTRTISCLKNRAGSSGFAIGGTGGRVAVQWVWYLMFEIKSTARWHVFLQVRWGQRPWVSTTYCLFKEIKNSGLMAFIIFRLNYAFRCHRQDSVPNSKDQKLVYSVNHISTHPVRGTFSSCGSYHLATWWNSDSQFSRVRWWYPLLGRGCSFAH